MYRDTLAALLALVIWLAAVVAVASVRPPPEASLFRSPPASYPQASLVETNTCAGIACW
jgi:hypothetical protein